MAWLIGRTQTNGTSDYDFVHSLQAQYTLTPLSAWGQEYAPPAEVPVDPSVDTQTAPVDQVAALTAQAFWTRFAELMKTNPPAEADAPMVEQLAQLGIVPGQSLDWDQLSSAEADALEAGMREGLAAIEAAAKNPAVEIKNTWAMAYQLGSYGTNYLLRAGTAWLAPGANLPEDAIYPSTRMDSTGQPLNGANRYVLHFEKDEIPPVEAFWSMTMYNDQQFLVSNPLDRYAIGDRDELVFGPDGSLDIFIQHESPGADRESNWLPAPDDLFNLILRLYWPKPAGARWHLGATCGDGGHGVAPSVNEHPSRVPRGVTRKGTSDGPDTFRSVDATPCDSHLAPRRAGRYPDWRGSGLGVR